MPLNAYLTDKTIITVSGAYSGVGKTLLSEYILTLVKNFAAIKITIEADLATMVSDDEKTIMVPGKDTFRLKSKGATKVVWVRSARQHLPEAMGKALLLTGNCQKILIEGNSILNYLEPNLAFFVAGGDLGHMKPGGLTLLQKATIIINNIRDKATNQEPVEKSLRQSNPGASIVSMNLENQSVVLPYLKTVLHAFMKED